jgi:hypothetical protein
MLAPKNVTAQQMMTVEQRAKQRIAIEQVHNR